VVKINLIDSFSNISTGSSPIANRTYTGSGEQVVYNGRANGPVTVIGLSPHTKYFFKVYPYSCSNNTYVNKGGILNPSSARTTGGVGMEESNAFDELSIFPNPNSGEFTLSANGEINLITIYSIEGKQLLELHTHQSQVQVVSNLPSGIYFLQVIVGKEKIIHKLSIH